MTASEARQDPDQHIRPAYGRVSDPPPMRITDRDRRILEAIHDHDGILSHPQLRRLFFTSDTQLRVRMGLLYQHGYVNRPTRKQRAMLDHMLYWLDEKGAALIAGLAGESLEGFAYRKEPRWIQVAHDLAVNDVRIAFAQACERTEDFELMEWIPETDFHAYPDRVEYTLPNGTHQARNVTPDGFCVIERQGKTFRFLLELDNRTSHNPKFAREKVIPGLAYIKSLPYKQRFGVNTGQWLIVTTGERRLRNLKQQTERTADQGARWFYFAVLENVTAGTILTAPVWYRGGDDRPIPLFKPG